MEELSKLLSRFNGSPSEVQQELFFYLAGKAMWRRIFQNAFQNCEGCVNPDLIKHSCILLWNPFHLKENGLAEALTKKYYEISYSQLEWNKDFDTEIWLNKLVDKNLFSERFWNTRHRRSILKKNVANYIIAAAVEEENLILSRRLDLTLTE